MKKRFSFIMTILFLLILVTPNQPVKAATPSWPLLQNGSSGTNVYSLQYLLLNKGYSVSVDGMFGSGTESAVKSFQSSNALTADGIVGANTWSKLVVTISNGSNNNAVKAAQYQLMNKYGYSVSVDGIFGSGTESAVRSFQSKNGIASDGIVGPTTWQCLIGGTGGSTGGDFWTSRQSSWIHPLKGGPTLDPTTGGREFGAGRSNGRYHAGVDFTAEAGRQVLAMTSGQVINIYEFYEGTKAVEVKNDDGTVARYCEISSWVSVGGRVSKGTVVGTVMRSNTGSQMLHLEVYMGTVSGALTQTANSSNYYYVSPANYQRRADLVNPTGAKNLSIIR